MKTLADSLIFWIICFILFLAPIAYGAVDPGTQAIIAILILLICLLWLFDAWKTSKLRVSDNPLQLPVIGLILIGLFQLLPLRALHSENLPVETASTLSLDPYATRFAVILLVIYLIFFTATLTFVRDEVRIRKITVFLVIFGMILAFIGILQQLTDPQSIFGFRIVKDAIPYGTFVNRHHFASFMIMLTGLALGLVCGKGIKTDKKTLVWIAIVMMTLAIIISGSRGGLLSLIGVVTFVLFKSAIVQSQEQEKSRLPIFAVAFGLLFLVVALVTFLGVDESLVRALGLKFQEDVSGGRFHFWAVAWRVFLDYPILGTGLGSFATVFPHYDTWNGIFRVEHAHNDYLEILSDAGILGFACVTTFVYWLFKLSFQNIRNQRDEFLKSIAIGALADCIGVLIHSFFDFPLRTNSNSFYFLLLASLASEVAEQSSKSEISGGH